MGKKKKLSCLAESFTCYFLLAVCQVSMAECSAQGGGSSVSETQSLQSLEDAGVGFLMGVVPCLLEADYDSISSLHVIRIFFNQYNTVSRRNYQWTEHWNTGMQCRNTRFNEQDLRYLRIIESSSLEDTFQTVNSNNHPSTTTFFVVVVWLTFFCCLFLDCDF